MLANKVMTARDALSPRLGGFLMAVIAVLSMIFILPRLGVNLGGLLQKAMALFPIIRAFLPFQIWPTRYYSRLLVQIITGEQSSQKETQEMF